MRLVVAAVALGLLGCPAREPDAPTTEWADQNGLRAKVSACTGHSADASMVFFWPLRLGGFEDGSDTTECVRQAEDCDAVLACAGYEPGPCDVDRCNDGVATHCRRLNDQVVVSERTACALDPSGNTSCSVVDDPDEGHIAFCHGEACERDHCADNVKVQCRQGRAMRTDCAITDQICVEADGDPTCVFADACELDHCERDVVTLCTAGHVEIAQRCGAIVPGSHCADTMGAIDCRAERPDPFCSDFSSFTQWCEGDTAWVCASGVRVEVDCSALPGGGTCHEEAYGDGGSIARCLSADVAVEAKVD